MFCVQDSLHRPRRVHAFICPTEMFIGVQGLAKQYSADNLASARPCLTSLRNFPLEDMAKRQRAASANFMTFSWYGFPKQSSNAFHVVPFKQAAFRTSRGHMSLADVTAIERRVSNPSLKPLRLAHDPLDRCFGC